MKHLKTLRGRFALWTVGLLLAALLLFGAFIYVRTAQSLSDSVDSALMLAASELIAEVDIADDELVAVESVLEGSSTAPLLDMGFSFRVLDLGGQTIQAYGPYRNYPLQSDETIATDQAGTFATVTDTDTQHTLRVYSAAITDDEQPTGSMQVVHNLNDVEETLSQLLISLLLGGLLLVGLVGGGGYYLAARALAPIDKITNTVRQISAEDLSARLNLASRDDEAGRLALTFNSMLARLEDAFQRERRFIADASHELRTPLAAMETILSSTLTRSRTPAEYEQVLLDLGSETRRLHTLVEGLLHLTRSEAADSMARDPVNLSVLLADVADSLRPLAEEKGLSLTADIAGDLTMTGDSDGLIRLFLNLIANAINYTNQGGVAVAARREADGTVSVTVADTGVGIPAEHLPHIFDRFYRLDSSRSTQGTGLGLAIARNVARAHGGTIMVDSAADQGTTFKVRLATG